MAIFEAGDIVKSDIGMPIKIVKFLAAGGQGEVYVVEYAGKKKALKWYTNAGKTPQNFYENLKNNVNKGSPDAAFLWPEAITEEPKNFDNISGKDSFGVIMDLKPDGFVPMSNYLVSTLCGNKFKCIIDISIKILEAFQRLHLSGYCFNGLNDGDILINLETHDVLISGIENITPAGISLRLMNVPRYSAPEIVANGVCSQTAHTSRYSVYVILFMLLFGTHPLEGERWLVPCLSYKDMQELYGFNPVFIMDKEDESNRPDKEIHKYFIEMWNSVPEYMRELFLKVFSKESLLNPTQRCRESELLKVYCRFRSGIVECECGNEYSSENQIESICERCGQRITYKYIIRFLEDEYFIGAKKGTRLYRCQFRKTLPPYELTQPTMLVVASKDNPEQLGLKNISSECYEAFTPSGVKREITPGTIVPLKCGMKIKVLDKYIEICSN